MTNVLEEQLKEANKEEARQSIAVAEMLKSEGWKVLEKHVCLAIERHTRDLVNEDDPNKVRIAQAYVRALSNTLTTARQLAEIHKFLKKSESEVDLDLE